MNKLKDRIIVAFYGNVNSEIHYDSSRLLRDTEFLKSINEKNINLLEERITKEITRQNNILNTIKSKDNITNCMIEDNENYFILKTSRPNYLQSHTRTYIVSDKGEQILLPMSESKEIIPLDDENFLQIEKDKNEVITTVLHYSLQENEWKLVKTFKNMGLKYVSPHLLDNSKGSLYSQNVVNYTNLKNTQMLYNYKKQQIMIDEYSKASEDLDTFDKDIYPDAIRISKYGAYYQLDYLVNKEGQLISEFKIVGQEDLRIDQQNIDENQRDYINRIIESCNNRPKSNTTKVFQKVNQTN